LAAPGGAATSGMRYALSVLMQTPPVSPFLKWAGGGSLIPQMFPLFPRHFSGYLSLSWGAAVFLHIRPPRAVLSDINPRLIDCYAAVRDEVAVVIDYLEAFRRAHSTEAFYAARERLNRSQVGLSRAERAALHIYLNKTCYNGLYRENRRGHFNVPMGRYKSPRIYSPAHLAEVSALLQGAELRCASFDETVQSAGPDDFVYFDPPYDPVSDTSNFTGYTRFGFGAADQERLATLCRDLDQRGCKVLVSNSNTPRIRRLYRGFAILPVEARRRINSKATRRGAIQELLIRNYP
jgi:DNA adenine methylase